MQKIPFTPYYKKSDLQILLELEEKYDGVYSVRGARGFGNRRIVMISDMEKVQVW